MKPLLCLIAGFAAEICAVNFRLLPPLDLERAGAVQALIEGALVIGLFCAGLRLASLLDRAAAWHVPLRLAAVTMPVTAALIAGAARVFLGLPFGEALILGAILAPTDPVLAGVLELPDPARGSPARFALAAEGALTSCLALPLVQLVIGLHGGRDLGLFGSRWLVMDVAWAVAGGALLGALVGSAAAWALTRIDSRAELGWFAVLLAASALASAYGASLIIEVNGLVAALAAGASLAFGGLIRRRRPGAPRRARLARRFATGAERVERAVELTAVALLGALLAGSPARPALILFALVVLVAVRPLAARLGIAAEPFDEPARRMLAWFGVRGIASLYLLLLTLDDAAAGAHGAELSAITLTVLATSIALHGLTALPLGKRPAGAQGSR